MSQKTCLTPDAARNMERIKMIRSRRRGVYPVGCELKDGVKLGTVLEVPMGWGPRAFFVSGPDDEVAHRNKQEQWKPYEGRAIMTVETTLTEKAHRPGLVTAGRKIEEESFRIIDAEMGDHSFPPDQWQIVRRVIHTTGDFDYANWIRFHQDAMSSGVAALRRGAAIFTDTRMIHVGLSPWRLGWFENKVETPPVQPESHSWAEQMGTTRSVAAFNHYASRINNNIVAIGNAPTALLEVIRLITEEGIRPALVVGAPVGFVQAAESKDALRQLDQQPFITVLGRKGGSAVAVAILHALLEHARTENQ